ncbi:MAG: IS1595 family transposase [Burkholderiales bacterium]|nr:IS1595 family transposase [Burkholderiales bacterium]
MKYTFIQFKEQYPNDDACLESIKQRRFGEGSACPSCGVVPAKFHRITGRRAYACQDCGHHVYPCAGTIFEHSSTPLTLWFHAMYLMTSTRNGVSAKELQRQLGVTYKCAWRIGHQLRILMAARDAANNPTPREGHFEIDETYVGGKVKGKGRRFVKNKAVVMGIVQRGGALTGKVVRNNKAETLVPVVMDTIEPGSIVNTDELSSYKPLESLGYHHVALNHSQEQWALGPHHTNRIEGFWSHLKRGISSTHVAVSKKHLQKYVDEFAFRYNNRKEPAVMFERMLAQVSNPTST